MRRGDLTYLGELSVGQFDALVARGLAPFSRSRRAAGWGTFTADDAFRVTLFNALTNAGLPQARASSTVRGQYDELIEMVSDGGEGDVWFGSFSSVAYGEADEASATAWFPLITTFAELQRTISKVQADGGDHDAVEAVVMINATSVMRRMLRRAEARGIVDRRLSELARLTRAV